MKRISILLSLMAGVILAGSCVSQEDIEKLQNQIDQQNSRIQTSIAELESTDKALKVYIEDLTKTAESLQKSISQTDAKLEAAKQELDKALNDTAAEVLAQLTAARTELQNQIDKINATIEILKARDTELEEKIEGLRDYVDSAFVTTDQYNSVLETISSIQQTIEGLNKSVTAAETRIEEVAASLEPLKNEIISEITSSITADYKSAIASAKAETEAAYTKAIADAIAALETSLKAWVNEQIGVILARIQSVSYVPRYSDGKAAMTYYTDNGLVIPCVAFLDFEVRPALAAAEIAKVWQSAISMSAVYTVTRTAPEVVPLTVESVTEDNGFLTVEVSGSKFSDDFYNNNCSANVRMEISDGNNDLLTEYIQVVPWFIPKSITLDKKSVYLSPEETVTLNTTVDVESVFQPYLPPIVWNSSDPSVATVSNGIVTAKKIGNAKITARAGDKTASCAIAVDDGRVYTDLSTVGSANCYLISQAGNYKFKALKGNSADSVGDVSTVEVLWESFGTKVKPEVGDLIIPALFKEGYVHFSTPETFANGNAVIAAKDSEGNILWSWHIWCSEEGWQEHIYNNNAGTMMDRNLGATSATPGDVGALGLLYQWGRKDPFLGSSSISSSVQALSTGTWETSSTWITNALAISNPTTFFMGELSCLPNSNWQLKKTACDPCPVGWRIPAGGENGIWKSAGFANSSFDSTNRGYSFSISSPETTWYPASGYLNNVDGVLSNNGSYGCYWSATHDDYYGACNLNFDGNGIVNPTDDYYLRSYGYSVRCLKE